MLPGDEAASRSVGQLADVVAPSLVHICQEMFQELILAIESCCNSWVLWCKISVSGVEMIVWHVRRLMSSLNELFVVYSQQSAEEEEESVHTPC